jgi:hypothetical protein
MIAKTCIALIWEIPQTPARDSNQILGFHSAISPTKKISLAVEAKLDDLIAGNHQMPSTLVAQISTSNGAEVRHEF